MTVMHGRAREGRLVLRIRGLLRLAQDWQRTPCLGVKFVSVRPPE